MERDKPKKSESFGQILPQLPWKPKRGDLKDFWIPFGGLQKFKMAAVAMVTKVQKMLNSLQTPTIFAVMFPVTSTSSGTR